MSRDHRQSLSVPRRSTGDRRRFLVASGAWALAAAPLARPTRAEQQPAGRGSESTSPTALKATGGALCRVRLEMSVKGNVDVPENPLVSRKSHRQLPLKSRAVLDYEERQRHPEEAAEHSIVIAAERHYHEATSEIELGKRQREIALRDAVRQTIVRRDRLPEVIYSVEDYFTHEELDLLNLPASSIALDRMLPSTPVRSGSSYRPSNEVLCSVLNLTSVEASEVEATVTAITEAAAKIEFRGSLDGSVRGVPTRMRLVGKLRFDRRRGLSDWLAMAIHETREIGKAEPGFDVSATIKLRREPLSEPAALPVTPPPLALTEPIPPERLYVDLRSDELGVSVLMNRNWRLMRDVPGSAMMRMIENDRSIAQCDLRPLPKLAAGKQWTLEAFQRDVQRTLGEQLEQLIEANQQVSDTGLRVLKVTAGGRVEGIPMRWVLLHFSDDSGRRLSATFTMEEQSAESFAGSDVQLAHSLRLVEPPEPDDESAESDGAGLAEAASGERPGESSSDGANAVRL